MGSMAEKVEKVEKKSVFVGGGNGQGSTGSHATDLEHAKDVARRYRLTVEAAVSAAFKTLCTRHACHHNFQHPFYLG